MVKSRERDSIQVHESLAGNYEDSIRLYDVSDRSAKNSVFESSKSQHPNAPSEVVGAQPLE